MELLVVNYIVRICLAILASVGNVESETYMQICGQKSKDYNTVTAIFAP